MVGNLPLVTSVFTPADSPRFVVEDARAKDQYAASSSARIILLFWDVILGDTADLILAAARDPGHFHAKKSEDG
jgi:hypothetical protein